jgi:NADH-quinone oxidoreductase subunit M
MIYERYHTREIAELGGIARRTPRLAAMAVLFALASIGLPGLSGFVGELMVLLGMFQRGWNEAGPLAWQFRVIAVAAVSGVVLGAWYMLWLVERVLFGPLREPAGGNHHDHVISDLSLREGLALAPLVVWMFWIGLAPDYFLQRTNKAAEQALVSVPASISQPADNTADLTFARPRP